MGEHILIVEDEEKLARFVELELLHEGYTAEKAFDGRTGLSMAQTGTFALILLDIMLPGLNGLEVLRRLKNGGTTTPVILLTARDAVMDKVMGLDGGAVDYITKPFAIEELLARIRVVLKMQSRLREIEAGGMKENREEADKKQGILRWKDLEMQVPAHRVTYEGHEITLTNREFLMLQELLTNQNIVLSRETLLERACGYDYIGETNVVDVYIRYLRTKIDEAFGIKMIQTVRGVGYVIKTGE